jgi:hypothetical protein
LWCTNLFVSRVPNRCSRRRRIGGESAIQHNPCPFFNAYFSKNKKVKHKRIGESGGEVCFVLVFVELAKILVIYPFLLTFSTNERFNCIISRPAKHSYSSYSFFSPFSLSPSLSVICHQNFNKIEQKKEEKKKLFWSLNFFFFFLYVSWLFFFCFWASFCFFFNEQMMMAWSSWDLCVWSGGKRVFCPQVVKIWGFCFSFKDILKVLRHQSKRKRNECIKVYKVCDSRRWSCW